MVKVNSTIFYEDGTFHYERYTRNEQLYSWKYEDGHLWWTPTANIIANAHWIKWSSYYNEDLAVIEAIKNLIIEGIVLKDCERD